MEETKESWKLIKKRLSFTNSMTNVRVKVMNKCETEDYAKLL
jgi:hypothetical protein